MNIAVLSAACSSHTVKIVNGLAELGHRVTLFSLPGHRDADGAVASSVAVRYLSKNSYLTCGRELSAGLKDCGAELLYAHYATGYGTLARKSRFHPTVLAVWGSDVYDFPDKSWIHAAILRQNLRFADRIFSTSECMARRTARFTNKTVTVTPFGVDLDRFCPSEKLGKATVCFGYLKGISHIYGVSCLLEAYARLLEDHPGIDVRLDLYGDGDLLPKLKEFCQSHQLNSVTFYGRVPHDNAPSVLQRMDVFCAPSLRESFGVAAVEAMACGVPVIAGTAEGLREVTEHGVTGLTVDPCDTPAFSQALWELYRDSDRRKQMGLNGRKRVEERYDWRLNLLTIEKELVKTVNG